MNDVVGFEHKIVVLFYVVRGEAKKGGDKECEREKYMCVSVCVCVCVCVTVRQGI